VILKILAVAVG